MAQSASVERNPGLRIEIDLAVNFCVYVLASDGLRVPPFVEHGPGNGQLQEAGLDGPTWLNWVRLVASQGLAVSPGLDRAIASTPVVMRNKIGSLRFAYEHDAKNWRQQTIDRLPSLLERTGGQLLTQRQSAITRRIPLEVFLVAYPTPVLCRLASRRVLISVSGTTLPDTFVDLLASGLGIPRPNDSTWPPDAFGSNGGQVLAYVSRLQNLSVDHLTLANRQSTHSQVQEACQQASIRAREAGRIAEVMAAVNAVRNATLPEAARDSYRAPSNAELGAIGLVCKDLLPSTTFLRLWSAIEGVISETDLI